MAYLGNSPVLSQQEYRNIDNISGSFNGSTTSFALLVNGVAPVPAPQSSNQCLISVNGVVQKPDDTGATGFRLSGGNIVFSAAPTSGQSFFGVILAGADYIYAGQNFPDGTVTAPPITFNQDLDTGFYRSGSGEVKFTANGANAITLSSNNLTAPSFVPTSSAAPTNGVYLSAANTVAIATNSTGKLFVNSSGQVGIGNSSPAGLLHLSSTFGTTLTTGFRIDGVGTTTNNVAPISFYTQSSNWGTQHAANIACGNLSGTDGGGYLRFSTSPDGNTAPSERLRITAAGLVGIGTTSPSQKLEVNGNIRILNANNLQLANTGDVQFLNAAGTSYSTGIIGSSDNMILYTTDLERARIDSSGRLLVGTSTARTNFFATTYGGPLQIETANNNSNRTTSITYGNSSNAGPLVALAKHRSTSVGGQTIVQNGDETGILSFQGSDGTNFMDTARIEAFVDGTPGTNDMPGRLVFSTTADGASSPTERMRIDSVGRTLINFQTPGSGGTAPLQVRASDSGAWGINLLMRNSGNDYGYFTFLDNDASEVLGAIYCERSGANLGNVIIETNNAGGSTARLKIANNGQLSAVVPGNSTLYPGFMARAWVNFDGTSGSIGSGRANGNVSSITDNGTGDFTVNFTTAMPDANYAVIGMCGSNTNGNRNMESHINNSGSTRINTTRSSDGSLQDVDLNSVAIFR